jgi:hypothetical protein
MVVVAIILCIKRHNESFGNLDFRAGESAREQLDIPGAPKMAENLGV